MHRPRSEVLFLCTGNSARSIMAEAAMNKHGEGRIRAFSAGSHPTGLLHPMALEVLREQGCDVSNLRSKSWDEFARTDRNLDFIITVCDNARGESCPIWPGHPLIAHWGVADPVAFKGRPSEQYLFFLRIYSELEARIQALAKLDIQSLGEPALQKALNEIGKNPPMAKTP